MKQNIATKINKTQIHALVALLIMGTSAVLASTMTPRSMYAVIHGELNLSSAIPNQFNDWTPERSATTNVVNPQQTDTLNRIYNQILTRTYTNTSGYRIMLSIAYGKDQRADMAAHYPEVCYPAQGFTVTSISERNINIGYKSLRVKNLDTNLQERRREAVTYWMTIGDQTTLTALDRRIKELRYGLTGIIPDGLIFRISSISDNPNAAFLVQEKFLHDLFENINRSDAARLAGIP